MTALTAGWRVLAAAPVFRRLLAGSVTVVAVAAAVVVFGGAPVGLLVDLTVLTVAGVGGLVMHELGHATAHAIVAPDGERRVEARGFSIVVVVDQPVDGLRQSAIAAAGPLAGAATALALLPVAAGNGVCLALAACHLVLLTPLGADGRQFLRGVATAAAGSDGTRAMRRRQERAEQAGMQRPS